MKRFLAHLIAALEATFASAASLRAEIVIGMPGPMSGGMAWFGEQMEQARQ